MNRFKKKTTPITWPSGFWSVKAQITRHSAHEGGKVVTLTHRPPLPPGISWYSFLEAESTPGHTEMSASPHGIDPGSFRLVAQCLNHCATPN